MIEAMPNTLPPEIEKGNIEYKLKLVNPSDERFEHLVTQMKWRLQEGQGEALYEIGVEDSGTVAGLNEYELDASLKTLQNMAKRLGAETSVLRERQIEPTSEDEVRKRAVEVLVRKVPDDQQFIDLRLVVLGNCDAGKSTLLGVLTQGELDNGRGCARLNLFRHLHEIQTGRTSSISHEILGFDSKGEVVNYSESRTTEDILEESTKLITLIDLCGHQKYLKTTVFGLTGSYPDFAMLVVSATGGIAGTTKEHLEYAIALGLPIFVAITKVDICPTSKLKQTLKQLENLLKLPGYKKVPFRVKTLDDAITAASNFHSDCICPIFKLSNVTGKNMDLLMTFLNVMSPAHGVKEREKLQQQEAEFQIDDVYTVPEVGTVVSGTICRGVIKCGDQLLVGPSDLGYFDSVTVRSIHRNQLNCKHITAGQAATLSLANFDNYMLRKGMVLLSKCKPEPAPCIEFEAKIYILSSNHKSMSPGYQPVIHIGNVCQPATLVHIDKDVANSGDKAVVKFRFISRPEFIHAGAKFLFRSGGRKGMGEVTAIFPYETLIR